MVLQMNCFRCKKSYEVDLKEEHVHKTTNERYVANFTCATCGRKMTSLIKKEAYINILKPEAIVEND